MSISISSSSSIGISGSDNSSGSGSSSSWPGERESRMSAVLQVISSKPYYDYY